MTARAARAKELGIQLGADGRAMSRVTDSVYLARVVPDNDATARLIVIPRAQVVELSIGGNESLVRARARARQLLDELRRCRAPAATTC